MGKEQVKKLRLSTPKSPKGELKYVIIVNEEISKKIAIVKD